MRLFLALIALHLAPSAFAQVAYLRDQPDDWSRRTAIPGFLFGSKISIDEQPCCALGQGTTAAELPDSNVIARMPDRASRDGRVLKLRLIGGRTTRITDCDSGTGCTSESSRLHRLVGWWPDQRYYVVSVYGYEEHSAFLIREADGLVAEVAAPPVLSADGHYGLAWDFSLLTGPTMQLLDFRLEPPKLRDITDTIACSERKSAHPGPKAVWLDDTRIAFDDSTSLGGDGSGAHFRMTLELARNGTLRWECH